MPQIIFVLEYRHRHGTDLSAFRTAVEAEVAMAEFCVREAPLECPDFAAQIEHLVTLGDRQEAVALYLEHVTRENFEVHQVTLNDHNIVGFTIVERGCEVVHAAQSFPSGRNPGGTWCGRIFFWANHDVTFPVGTQNFKAFIPEEPRHLTCLACIGRETLAE